MGEWVLILTLVTAQGVAMHSVQMSSSEYCMSAGKDWQSMVHSNVRLAFYVCKPTYTHREYGR